MKESLPTLTADIKVWQADIIPVLELLTEGIRKVKVMSNLSIKKKKMMGT